MSPLTDGVNNYRLVFFILIVFYIHEITSVTLNILQKRGGYDFVEDEETIFLCNVPCKKRPCSNVKVRWILRDPIADHELFFELERYKVYYTDIDSNGIASFPVLIRRDFSHKQIMCQTDSGSSSMIIPEIKKTIDIEEVILNSTDVIPNKKVTLHCDVKAPVGKVRQVMFRTLYGRLPSSRNWTLGNGWRRYRYVSYRKNGMEINGTTVQCMAITGNSKSPRGAVVSEMKTLIMHYFKFLPRNDPPLSMNNTVRLFFTVKASPFPKAASFIHHCKYPNGTNRRLTPRKTTIRNIEKDIFNISLTFNLLNACNYTFQFKSHMINAQAKSSFADALTQQQQRSFGKFTTNTSDIASQWRRILKEQGIRLYSIEGIVHLTIASLQKNTMLEQKLDQLNKKIDDLKAMKTTDEDVLRDLPLNDIEGYNIFLSKLEDEGFRSKVVNGLRRVGGRNLQKHVANLINCLMTTSFQARFNLTGKDYSTGRVENAEKLTFSNKLEKLVIDSVSINETDDNAVRRIIRRQLKDARLRPTTLRKPMTEAN